MLVLVEGLPVGASLFSGERREIFARLWRTVDVPFFLILSEDPAWRGEFHHALGWTSCIKGLGLCLPEGEVGLCDGVPRVFAREDVLAGAHTFLCVKGE